MAELLPAEIPLPNSPTSPSPTALPETDPDQILAPEPSPAVSRAPTLDASPLDSLVSALSRVATAVLPQPEPVEPEEKDAASGEDTAKGDENAVKDETAANEKNAVDDEEVANEESPDEGQTGSVDERLEKVINELPTESTSAEAEAVQEELIVPAEADQNIQQQETIEATANERPEEETTAEKESTVTAVSQPPAEAPSTITTELVETLPSNIDESTPVLHNEEIPKSVQRTFTTPEGELLTVTEQPVDVTEETIDSTVAEPVEESVLVLEQPDQAVEDTEVITEKVPDEVDDAIVEEQTQEPDIVTIADNPTTVIESTTSVFEFDPGTDQPASVETASTEPAQLVVSDVQEAEVEDQKADSGDSSRIMAALDDIRAKLNDISRSTTQIEQVDTQTTQSKDFAMASEQSEVDSGRPSPTVNGRPATISAVPTNDSEFATPLLQRSQSVYTIMPSAAVCPPLYPPIAAVPSHIATMETQLLLQRLAVPTPSGETHRITDERGITQLYHVVLVPPPPANPSRARKVLVYTPTNTPLLALQPRRHRLSTLLGGVQWWLEVRVPGAEEGGVGGGGGSGSGSGSGSSSSSRRRSSGVPAAAMDGSKDTVTISADGLCWMACGQLKRRIRWPPLFRAASPSAEPSLAAAVAPTRRTGGLTGYFTRQDEHAAASISAAPDAARQRVFAKRDLLGAGDRMLHLGTSAEDPVAAVVQPVLFGGKMVRNSAVGSSVYGVRVVKGFDMALACAIVVAMDERGGFWWSQRGR